MASLLGFFCVFEAVPGVGSFGGSLLLVIGGTVLVFSVILRSNQKSPGVDTQGRHRPLTSRRNQFTPRYLYTLVPDIPSFLDTKFLAGSAVGMVATIMLGFSFGGWTVGSTAKFIAQRASSIAVVAALAPICVNQFRNAPDTAKNLTHLQKLNFLEQMTFVHAGGWSFMPGAERSTAAVAEACGAILIGDASDDEIGLSDRAWGFGQSIARARSVAAPRRWSGLRDFDRILRGAERTFHPAGGALRMLVNLNSGTQHFLHGRFRQPCAFRPRHFLVSRPMDNRARREEVITVAEHFGLSEHRMPNM
jgi:hypothetical protein